MEPRSLLRRASALAGAGVLAGGLLAAAPASAFADEVPPNGPGLGETSKSANVDTLAQLPIAPGANTNSDLAFQGDYAFSGHYNGFNVYDVSNPDEPELVTSVICPGSQNDISVYENYVFLSTDSVRSDDSCESSSGSSRDPNNWEGMKIFDISDINNPRYIKSIKTDCGSHTHSLAPSKDLESVYLYVSSYSPSATAVHCQPPHDKLSIIEVPLDNPTAAHVAAAPNLFPDGGNPGRNGSSTTSGCHDVTTYAAIDRMAGACMGDGVLWDISDRENPVQIDIVRDLENFSFWHSATFNNTGDKIVFTDELGGGSGARCRVDEWDTKGANAIYDIDGGTELAFKSYYKLPRIQGNTENCVAHNGSLIPVKGKDIMVQAWYQGGFTVFDFTDSANPVELAHFDQGPIDPNRLVLGGYWSSYWYNGSIISNEIYRGFDTHELTGAEWDQAKSVKQTSSNPQMQQLHVEALSFDGLGDLIDDSDLSSSASASLSNRVDYVNRMAAQGSEARTVAGLDQLIARAKNQIKGDAADIAARDAIVAEAQSLRDLIAAADHYEK
jgi:hypothetical protein